MRRQRNWHEKLLIEKREIVLWGTGRHAERAFLYLKAEGQNYYHIDFVIDNYFNAETMEWMGLPVRHPTQVENWEDLFIIVAVKDVYPKIKSQLDGLGLHENCDYVNWQEIDRKYVLGISTRYPFFEAALLDNGEVVTAFKEERVAWQKNDFGFPQNAICSCLEEAGITFSDIDAVVYYDNPLLATDRLLHNLQIVTDRDPKLTEREMEILLTDKIWIHRKIQAFSCGKIKKEKIFACEYHMAHVASAFYPSPFEEAAVLTFDGFEEWETAAIGIGKKNGLKILKYIDYPHSLRLLYSAFTLFCGFRANLEEYKLMELARYGKPVYYEKIKQKLITIYEDGSYRLHLEYFDFISGGNMTKNKFTELFGGEAGKPESLISVFKMNLAASIQKVTEEIIIKTARFARELTGMDNLCLAGGTVLNCVANEMLLREKVFDRIWIRPASGDDGGALGGAYYLYYTYWDRLRRVQERDAWCDYQNRKEEFYE